MKYFLNIYSPRTYALVNPETLQECGIRDRYKNLCSKVEPGDKFICYMVWLSRWIGVLEVLEKVHEAPTHKIYYENDPYKLHFKIRPLVWLPKEKTIPVKLDWDKISFLKKLSNKKGWGAVFQRGIGSISEEDGRILENLLINQVASSINYAIEKTVWEKSIAHISPNSIIVTERGEIPVSIPKEEEKKEEIEVRESLKMQSLVASIGERMGFKIWIPTHDRNKVKDIAKLKDASVLEVLPFDFNETANQTIEQIDVLWTKRNKIIRAFEIEHTTSIYSGILRMADLIATLPNMDIPIHIVAPEGRRNQVLREIGRPVFALMEDGKMLELCSFISYDGIITISNQAVEYMKDEILEMYSTYVESQY